MFDPHGLSRSKRTSNSKKGQVIQQRLVDPLPYFNKNDILKYIPYIIKNGLLDNLIFRLFLHQWRFLGLHDNEHLLTINLHLFRETEFTNYDFQFQAGRRPNLITLPPGWYETYAENSYTQLSLLIFWKIPDAPNYMFISVLSFCLNITPDVIARHPETLVFNDTSIGEDNEWYDNSPISEFPINELKCDIIPEITFNNQISAIDDQPLFSVFNFDDPKLTEYVQFSNYQYDRHQNMPLGFEFSDQSVSTSPNTMSYSWLKIPKGLSILNF